MHAPSATEPQLPALPERWLKKCTIAGLYDADVSTVEGWVRDGCPSRMVGGVRLFRYSEVDAWLTERERRAGEWEAA